MKITKNKLVNFYCAMWLMVLEFTLKVWGVIMRHCLAMKGIDPKNIKLRQTNWALVFQNELRAHFESEFPLTLEHMAEEAARASQEAIDNLNTKLREDAERARKSLGTFEPNGEFKVAKFHRNLNAIPSEEEMNAVHMARLEGIIGRSKPYEGEPTITESDVSNILGLSANVSSDLVNTSNQTFVLEVGEPIPTLTAESPKSEITLARNTKTIKEQTKSQIKRQVEASNKRKKSKKTKLGKAKVKKVSKTNR
jgi:hypothetical protein